MNEKILQRLGHLFETGELSNQDMVQIIELCGSYLNLCSIADYARQHSLSYNGVKKCRHVVRLFNTKFVVDNE